ncbi:hypothetical protein KXV98_008552, partial [Aspergillus fumigatus]
MTTVQSLLSLLRNTRTLAVSGVHRGHSGSHNVASCFLVSFSAVCCCQLCFGILPLFEHFNHTFSHLSEGFLKVAGSRFLLTTVMLKTAFLIGETRVGELQLMVFPLKARAVGMLRH